jgi:inner membrane protein
MPSPIGHALAGIAAGWLVDPAPARDAQGAMWRAAMFGAAAMAPDIDLLFGAHRGPTHGLGAAVLAGVFVWILEGQAARLTAGRVSSADAGSLSRVRFALAIALAYVSHTLLDWLGNDTSPPIGIMALWPFSPDYYQSGLPVFMGISRQYWLREFWVSNARALAGELAILLPLVALVFFARRRPT